MVKKSLLVLLAFWVPFAVAEEAPVSDTEVWNEGVECYRRGDMTNALRLLRSLMPSSPLTRSGEYGARAAEVVAKLEHERENREEAARAAQIALRAAPADEKANRNFTRATDGLLQARETRRVEAVLKAAQGQDPGSMMLVAAKDARRLLEESGSFVTNRPERVVVLSDALSRRAETLADAWLPLREVIAQSATNQEQAAACLVQVEQARKKTKKAAKEIGDLMSSEAYVTMSGVESDFTRFLKLTVMPPAAIDEDLVAQSNAWMDVEAFNGRSWQQDALDYTRAFRARFPAWAQAYEQQAQSDTNKPPFAKEDQGKVSALATELEKLQIECTTKSLPPSQEKAIDLICQIRDLLPKDKNGGGGQNNQQQDSRQNQDKQNQDKQDQNKQNQQQQQQEPPQQSDQKKDQDKQEPQESDEQKEDLEDQELEAVLKKAQERNDEHEAEKKARMRNATLPPNERDW